MTLGSCRCADCLECDLRDMRRRTEARRALASRAAEAAETHGRALVIARRTGRPVYLVEDELRKGRAA